MNSKIKVKYYFLSGAGSGGAFTGIIKYLKEKDKKIKGILAD